MRVYTYKSPFEMDKMSIWSDIKKYPNLCVSQTLVEGMKEYYNRESFGVICTIDTLLKKMYKEWCDDTENDIAQSIIISNKIEELPDSNFKNTIKHNKKDVTKSIKYLIESDIDASIDRGGLPIEQCLLLDIYREVEDLAEFTKLIKVDTINKNELGKKFTDILREELLKYIDSPEILTEINKISTLPDKDRRLLLEIKRIKNKIDNDLETCSMKKGVVIQRADRREYAEHRRQQLINKIQKIEMIEKQFLIYRDKGQRIDYSKIFIHGVHQFTPMILRLIRDLEEMGCDIIFVFNYMEEYSQIYKTWKNVYEWVGEDEDCDENWFIKEGFGHLQGRELGYTLSHVYEGDFSKVDDKYDVTYTAFDNLTSFSDYVSQIYMEAVKEYDLHYPDKNSRPVNEKLTKLALMKEQFYAINGTQMNELLKVYFPEQFSSRHFLSYPIGQFIKRLYKMWDEKEQKLVIDEQHIKEALALTVWNKEDMPTPLEIFYNIKYCFKEADNFNEYIDVLKNIKTVVSKASDTRVKRISFFIYNSAEIDYFTNVIKEIQLIAEQLFSEKRMPVKKHYKELVEQILGNEAISNNITPDELDFVKYIKTHLDKHEGIEQDAYMSDIRDTIGYYLQSNSDSTYEAEWIVRDFEQIDGGVLLAAAQKRDAGETIGEKTFHYAGLSDENMLGKERVQLPWPLDEELFIRSDNKVAEICSKSRSEYNYFLRYSLFYGTYFLSENKNMALSYIKKLGDKEANPYSAMSLINIHANEAEIEKYLGESYDIEDYYNNYAIEVKMPINDTEKRSMKACFKRYLFNHCLDKDVYFSDDFYLEYICKFFIRYGYIRKHREENKGYIIDESILNKFLKYFPFFRDSDIEEIKNDINYDIKNKKSNDENYIDSKMEFIYKTWKEDKGQGKDVFAYFMKNSSNDSQIYKKFEKFVENSEQFVKGEEHSKKVCDVCNQRYLCLDRI